MRLFSVGLALMLSAAATPAFATESLTCAAPGDKGPMVGLAIGHAAEPAVASAYFQADGAEVKVVVSQSWLDDDKVWVNLGDPDLMEVLVKMRMSGPPDKLRGTIVYKGKTYKASCSFDD